VLFLLCHKTCSPIFQPHRRITAEVAAALRNTVVAVPASSLPVVHPQPVADNSTAVVVVAAAVAVAVVEAVQLALAQMKEERTVWKGEDAFEATWRLGPDVVISQERFPSGGHNDVMNYAPVTLAIMKAFDLDE